MEPRRIEDALELLRSEYLDMPKLSFTPGEVARILNIDPPPARVLLQTLEDSHFLNTRGMGDSPALCITAEAARATTGERLTGSPRR